MKKRYCPIHALPAYAFIPGHNPHPFKEGGHWQGQHEPIAQVISNESPKLNEDFLYALDLVNHHFFWEAHVYLEALWNAHQRKGEVADLLKAIIIYCAGKIKEQAQQSEVAYHQFARAIELLSPLKGKKIIDIHIDHLIEMIKVNDVFIELE